MDHFEIEVKFLIKDIPSIRQHLIKIGARSQNRHFEKNYRYDDSTKRLLKNKSILRLRKTDKNFLTMKSRPPETEDKHFKIHREIELEVSDFEAMDQIIKMLGYHKEQIYEKWRETFTYNDIVFCVDELPFGNFLEIEGDRQGIIEMAEKLELKWNERILISYLEIFDIIKEKERLEFTDITFDNFKDKKRDIFEIRDMLYA